jgi:hypothetical protein
MASHPTAETLSGYLDRELGQDERRSVEEHLAACQRCRDEVAALSWTVEFVRAMPRAPIPPGVSFHVPVPADEELDEELAGSGGGGRLSWLAWGSLGVAAVAVALAVSTAVGPAAAPTDVRQAAAVAEPSNESAAPQSPAMAPAGFPAAADESGAQASPPAAGMPTAPHEAAAARGDLAATAPAALAGTEQTMELEQALDFDARVATEVALGPEVGGAEGVVISPEQHATDVVRRLRADDAALRAAQQSATVPAPPSATADLYLKAPPPAAPTRSAGAGFAAIGLAALAVGAFAFWLGRRSRL